MKLGFFLLLIFTISCSQVSLRGPASVQSQEQVAGEVDLQRSKVKVFNSNDIFLDLRDSNGKSVDCDLALISLKKNNGQKVKFQIERSSKGKFYLIPHEPHKIGEIPLKIYIKNKILSQNLKLVLKKPERNKSSIKAVRSERNGIKLRLFLGDDKGKPVEIPSRPEIILDGHAEIENLVQVAPGICEFELIYPNYNQVIYVSVRAHGTLLADLFRVQHIEK